VLSHIGLVSLATMAMMAVDVSVEPEERLYQHVVRFTLTVALCVWMYRGSPIARWIAIVFFGAAGLLGLINFLSGSFAAFVLGLCSAAYLSFAIVDATSSEAKVFLHQQRTPVTEKGAL